MKDRSSALARFQVLAAAVLFSTGGVAIKATDLDAWQVACFRSAVAAAALLLMLTATRRRWSWRSLAVGVAYAGALILYVLANKLTTAANTIFLQSTAPLYIMVLAPWLLREPLRRRDLVLTLVMAWGMGLFFWEVDPAVATAPDPLRGNLLAAAAGVCWALAVIGLRWMSREGAGVTGSAGSAVVAGNLLAVVFCLPRALPAAAVPAIDWVLILYLGVIQIALAYLFLTSGLRGVPALEASLLLLLEPVLNPVWAWWAHGERPGRWAVAGGALILAATLVKTLVESRGGGRATRNRPPPE